MAEAAAIEVTEKVAEEDGSDDCDGEDGDDDENAWA